eukprot:4105877-Alexandrium_andersonii.AAC.1
MSASLVGSEMCIRDRLPLAPRNRHGTQCAASTQAPRPTNAHASTTLYLICLLYTSDAADDM